MSVSSLIKYSVLYHPQLFSYGVLKGDIRQSQAGTAQVKPLWLTKQCNCLWRQKQNSPQNWAFNESLTEALFSHFNEVCASNSKLQNNMNAHLLLPYGSATTQNTVIASLMLNRMVELPLGKKKKKVIIIHHIVTLNIQRHLIVLLKSIHWHINHVPVKTQLVQGATNPEKYLDSCLKCMKKIPKWVAFIFE